MKVFVPITDEFLYRAPEKISNKLVPYHPDYPCYRWLVDRSFETTAVSRQENQYTLGTRPEMRPAATHNRPKTISTCLPRSSDLLTHSDKIIRQTNSKGLCQPG